MLKITTRNAFTSKLRAVSNLKNNLTDLALYAIEQARQHSNLKELNELFNAPAFKLQSGLPNKLGKQLQAYVTAQYKALKFEHESAQTKITFSTNFDANNPKASGTIRRANIVSLTDTRDLAKNHTLVNGDDFNGFIYLSRNLYTNDLSKALSFEQWESLTKPVAPPKVPTISAKTLAGNLTALADKTAILSGKPDDLRTIVELAAQLHAIAYDALAQAASEVDLGALQQFETLKPSTLAKAANKKAAH